MELPVISYKELMKHYMRPSLWVVVEGMVYDVTTYLDYHPGGEEILRKCGAKDATEQFIEYNHSNYARSILQSRLIGRLTDEPCPDNYLQQLKLRKQRRKNPYGPITWEEVQKHNKDDPWIVIDGDVYDISDFKDHPGGVKILQEKAGDDASTFFHRIGHSSNAQQLMNEMQIGVVIGIYLNQCQKGVKPKKQEIQNNNTIVILIVCLVIILIYMLFK